MTFLHYLEDRLEGRLPFSVYTKELFTVKMKDAEGNEVELRSHAFSDAALKARKPEIVGKQLSREKLLRDGRPRSYTRTWCGSVRRKKIAGDGT
jgi:hypothetical protein